MKEFNFENWSKENCLELVSLIKESINWEDPLDVANDLLRLAMEFKSKGSPQAETYKKAHELAMENIYEGGGDPFKTALESNNPIDIVSTSLYMVADRLCKLGREGLIKNKKGEMPEGYFVAAFAQIEIIYGAFNILSCDTDELYRVTISSKILPQLFPEKHDKIKNSIDEYIRNKEIQIGVIEPLSFFLSLLLYDKKPNPKFLVNWLDGNVSQVIVKVLTGKPKEAVEMCEIYKSQSPENSNTYSWNQFYKEFDGNFDEDSSLLIELIDSEQTRSHLEKLGYTESTSKRLDYSRCGEYFPTCSDDEETLTIIIFHRLPLKFNFKKSKEFSKKWFGLNKNFIISIDYMELSELYKWLFSEEDRQIAIEFCEEFLDNDDEYADRFAKNILKGGVEYVFPDCDIIALLKNTLNIKDYVLYTIEQFWGKPENSTNYWWSSLEKFNGDIKVVEDSINWVEIERIWLLLQQKLGYQINEKNMNEKENPIKKNDSINYLEDTKETEKTFSAVWKLSEFKELLEKGLNFGSKYFFLVGGAHGLFFLVRDTDSEGLNSNPVRRPMSSFQIYAEGFKPDNIDSDDSEQVIEDMYQKVGRLFNGDICEWFRLSNELLDEVNTQIKKGFKKIKISSAPFEIDNEFLEDYPGKSGEVICHNVAIGFGGACPVDIFNAKINFQYINQSECLDLKDIYERNNFFVDKDEAKIIKFYIKVENDLADKDDYFAIRSSFINKNRNVEAVEFTLLLEKDVEDDYKYFYYSELAKFLLLAEDHINSLRYNFKALEYKPNDVPTLSNTANRLRDIGDLVEAEKYYQLAFGIDSNDPILRHNFEKLNNIKNKSLVSIDAFNKSLNYHFEIRQYGGICFSKCEYNFPTVKVIESFLKLTDFENSIYKEKGVDEETFMRVVLVLYDQLSNIDLCKDYITNLVKNAPKNELKEWEISSEENLRYKDINSFLNDLDFSQICFLFNRAWSDACDERKMEYLLSL